jgi:hypothetical protein
MSGGGGGGGGRGGGGGAGGVEDAGKFLERLEVRSLLALLVHKYKY